MEDRRVHFQLGHLLVKVEFPAKNKLGSFNVAHIST